MKEYDKEISTIIDGKIVFARLKIFRLTECWFAIAWNSEYSYVFGEDEISASALGGIEHLSDRDFLYRVKFTASHVGQALEWCEFEFDVPIWEPMPPPPQG